MLPSALSLPSPWPVTIASVTDSVLAGGLSARSFSFRFIEELIMPIVKLDSDFIKNQLICPTGMRRIEFCSQELPGLLVEVSNASPGKGTFMLRYKNSGRTKYIKIGRTYDISLADAKKKALQLKAEITTGGDPRQDKKDKRAVTTLTAFMEEYYFPYVRPRKRTAQKDEELYRLRLRKAFGDRQLN
jgi:hypothetical protein